MPENEFDDPYSAVAPSKIKRRRDLLPWWVIASIWLFLVFFAVMPVAVILGLLNYSFEISLLGVATDNAVSVTGLILILLFTLKGITAYGLWTEKKWAVGLAKIDAIISIAICCLVMIYPLIMPENHSFSIRLELIIIIPYYYKMNQIQYDWEYFGESEQVDPFSAEATSNTKI